MNIQLFKPATGQISLLIAPSATIAILMEMTAELSLQSRVIMVDGGNRFDGYGLARALRRRTVDLKSALDQVLLSRAFTCYQMAALLSEFPQSALPIIVLDMLATFLDENIRLETRQSLLGSCLMQLQRLSQSAPVVIWARKRSLPGIEDVGLLDQLLETAEKVWRLESPQPDTRQLSLFEMHTPGGS